MTIEISNERVQALKGAMDNRYELKGEFDEFIVELTQMLSGGSSNGFIMTFDTTKDYTDKEFYVDHFPFFFDDEITINWGDGNTSTYDYYDDINEEPYNEEDFRRTVHLDHTYEENGVYTITVTNLTGFYSASSEDGAFYPSRGITSMTIPDGITSLPDTFVWNQALESISIPSSVTTIGDYAFYECPDLTDVQLYWESNPVAYNSQTYTMPTNEDTVFTIPNGTTSIYVSAGYPSAKLVERQ